MGFLYPPLPPGDHVLKVFNKDEVLFGNGNIITYRIHVTPCPRPVAVPARDRRGGVTTRNQGRSSRAPGG